MTKKIVSFFLVPLLLLFNTQVASASIYDPLNRLMEVCGKDTLSAKVKCKAQSAAMSAGASVAFLVTLDILNTALGEEFHKEEHLKRILEEDPKDLATIYADPELREQFDGDVEKAKNKAKKAVDFFRSAQEGIDATLEVTEMLLDFHQEMEDAEVLEKLGAANDGLREANRGMKKMNSALDDVNAGLDKMNRGLDKANKGIDEANAGMAQINRGIDKANSGMEGMQGSLDGYMDGLEKIRYPSISGNLKFDFSRLKDELNAPDAQRVFEDHQRQQKLSLVLDLIPGIGDAKGVTEAVSGKNPVTGESVSSFDRTLGGVLFVGSLNDALKFTKKGSDHPASLFSALKHRNALKAAEEAESIVDSLKRTGELPSNYVTKEQARKEGWKNGKALGNYIPDGQIGGDVFMDRNKVLPSEQGRVWYEADVGVDNKMKRSNQPGWRLLYSDDGLVYVTSDHYETVYSLGKYK